MIYVGYQGVGKSSIAGKNNCIDLESGNFWVEGERPKDWYKFYCNIAQHLSNQGYNVFISSHKVVREELNRRNAKFKVICPSLDLATKWVERLQKRYDETHLLKDYKALMNAKVDYYDNISDLLSEKDVIIVNKLDYDLNDYIKGGE